MPTGKKRKSLSTKNLKHLRYNKKRKDVRKSLIVRKCKLIIFMQKCSKVQHKLGLSLTYGL